MSVELRPTFSLETERAPDDVIASLHAAFDRSEGSEAPGLDARWAGPHLLLGHVKVARRAWSPWLHIDVHEADENDRGSRISARFSPHPNLWTCYALTYLALGSLAIFAACFAGAQMFLGHSQWAWWIVLASLLIALGMWVAAIIGQRAAHDQMIDLRTRLEEAVGRPST